MASKNNYFIAVYTNECKDYCDEQFFERILDLKRNNYLGIVDNTVGNNYIKKLRKLAPTAAITKVNVPEQPKISQFQRNVTESVNSLRDDFLKTDKDYFLIIESDVMPPADLLDRFDKDIEYLNNIQPGVIKQSDKEIIIKPFGILGALYYDGFHDYSKEGLHETHHALSGCTVYKRELIEKFPFRYDPDNLGPFPDAWICVDSGKKYSIWNDYNIRCEHKHNINGTRMSKAL